jgi:recombination protein RecR
MPKEEALRLAEAIRAVKERVGSCGICGNFSEQDPCLICDDSGRDSGLVCVVEQPVDVLAFERTGQFKGRYHVLGGALSPLDGTHPDDLRIPQLLARLRASIEGAEANGIREIILATNPNVAGEATALYLSRLLRPLGIRITRIARGVPMGSDLEYSDLVTLARALEGRRDVE